MKDFVLLIVVLAAFIYGYFLMEKLDKFLKENQSQKLISDSKLRIGFETPAIIDSIYCRSIRTIFKRIPKL